MFCFVQEILKIISQEICYPTYRKKMEWLTLNSQTSVFKSLNRTQNLLSICVSHLWKSKSLGYKMPWTGHADGSC